MYISGPNCCSLFAQVALMYFMSFFSISLASFVNNGCKLIRKAVVLSYIIFQRWLWLAWYQRYKMLRGSGGIIISSKALVS